MTPPANLLEIPEEIQFGPAPTPPVAPPEPAPAVKPEPPPAPKIELKDFVPPPVSLNPEGPKPIPASGNEPLPAVVEPKAPEPPVEPPQENGIAQLRTRYEEMKASKLELEARLNESTALKAQREGEINQLRAELDALRTKVSATNPWEHPDVRSITDPTNQELANLPSRLKMSPEEARAFQANGNIPGLIGEFRAIGSPNDDGYAQRRRDFMMKVDDMFPDSGGAVRDAISRAAEALDRATMKVQEVQQRGGVMSFEESKAEYDKISRKYDEDVLEHGFSVSEEFASANPNHVMTILSGIVSSSPEVQKITDSIKAVLKKAAIPPAPINPTELERLSPEERQAMFDTRERDRSSTLESLMRQQPAQMLSYILLPSIFKKWQDAEERLKQIAGETPKPGAPLPAAPQSMSVADFKPPPIPRF